MSRAQKSRSLRSGNIGVAPSDIYDYATMPRRSRGRPPRHDPATWIVTDDWPERVPVSVAEIDIYEAWFGDLFDRIFRDGR